MLEVTKDFVSALKSANQAITVTMTLPDADDMDTRHLVTIRMMARVTAAVPAGYTIDTAGAYAEAVATYQYRSQDPISGRFRAASFTSIHPQAGQWQALALILRPGDMLDFTALDNSSSFLKSRNVHLDSLFAQISRKGKLILSWFLVDFGSGPADLAIGRNLKV